jgi:hypothetical protein
MVNNKLITSTSRISIDSFPYSYKEEDKGNVFVTKVYNEKLGKEEVNQVRLKNKYKKNNNCKTDIIQSFIITAAKYDFSLYEKRILFRTIECFQYLLENKKLDKNFSVREDLHGDITITLPISSLLVNGKGDTNHIQIKKAFDSLLNKKIVFENNNVWTKFTLIVKPEIIKYYRVVTFRLHQEVYEALLDFSKGYRKYELETAMTFKSVYSMRFYEFISGQKSIITYTIDSLKELFDIKNKYKFTKDFISNVIEPSKKELDLKAPFSFTYQLKYEKKRTNVNGGRKKIIGIIFTPVYHLKNRDKILARRDQYRNLDLLSVLSNEEIKTFMLFGFTENRLKSKYYTLFQDINKARKQGRIIITSNIISYAMKARNKKVYLINALKKEIKSWKEDILKKSNIFTFEDDININNDKEKSSIYSFLKNHLCVHTEDLKDGLIYVMKMGGIAYLNELLLIHNNNEEKIKSHIIEKLCIKKNVSKQKLDIVKFKKSKICFVSTGSGNMNYVNKNKNNSINSDVYSDDLQSDKYQTKILKHKFINTERELKKDWKKLVYKRMNFRYKLLYITKLINEKWLKIYAKQKNISIYKD